MNVNPPPHRMVVYLSTFSVKLPVQRAAMEVVEIQKGENYFSF